MKQTFSNKRTKVKLDLHLICFLKCLKIFFIFFITIFININLLNADNSAKCNVTWDKGKETAKCKNQGYISVPSIIRSNEIHVLRLENNNLQLLPARVFQEKGLINLQKIFLSNSTIGIINAEAFYQLINLIELDLRQNLLTDVPVHSFHNLINVRRLLLSYNPISTVKTNSFTHLTKLENLDLSNCQISLIEANAFRSLSNLKYFKLNNNKISTLNYNVLIDIPVLYTINLENNPWICDCNLRDLHNWIYNKNIHLDDIPICKSPSNYEGESWFKMNIDKLACIPKMLQTETEISARINSNATFTCRVKSSPRPEIDWQVEESTNFSSNNILSNQQHLLPLFKNNFVNFDDKYMASEIQQDDNVFFSILTLINFQPEDTSKKFICRAKNSAGFTQENFTIAIFSAHSAALSDWTNFGTIGTFLFILFSISILITLITLFGILYHRYKNQNEINSTISDNKSNIDNIKPSFNGNNNNLNNYKSDTNNKLNKNEFNNDLLNSQKIKITENNSDIYNPNFNDKIDSNKPDLMKKSLNNINNISAYRNTTGNNNLDSSSFTLLNNEVVAMSGDLMINQNSINVYNRIINSPQEFTIDSTTAENTINVPSQYASSYLQPSADHLMSYSNSNFIDPNTSGYLQFSGNEQLLNNYNNYENMYNHNIIDIQQQPYLLQNNYDNYLTRNESIQQISANLINSGEEGIYYQNTLGKQTTPLKGNNNLGLNVLSPNINVMLNQEMSIYGTLQQKNHHLSMQQLNNNQHHVNILGQGSYNIAAQPTVVRYSPDEGYAEEAANSNFNLEGTEV